MSQFDSDNKNRVDCENFDWHDFSRQLTSFLSPLWMTDDDPLIPYAHLELAAADKIVVTLGESWTWGNKLGPDRLKQVWGYKLAQKTQSSWLNVARCGSSNLWIAYQLAELNRWLDNNGVWPFHTTTIFVCWTETSRELTENWEWYQINPQSAFDSLPRDQSVVETVMAMNDLIVRFVDKELERLKSRISLDFWSCHNFCSPKFWRYDWNHPEKNWVEVLADHLGMPYDGCPASVGYKWFGRIKEHLKDHEDKMLQINQLIDESKKVMDFLDASPLNYPKPSQHPNPEAHSVWADYLFDCLTHYGNERK